MSGNGQPGFIDDERQFDMFGGDAAPAYRPDPDRVRARLDKILAEARDARTMPWSRARLSLYRAIVPQMTRWLPDEEGAQFRFAFEEELERLDAA